MLLQDQEYQLKVKDTKNQLRSLELKPGPTDFETMARLCLELAALEEETGKIPESIQFLHKGLVCAKKGRYDSIQPLFYARLSFAHEQLGNYKASLGHYQKYISMRDSLYNIQNISRFMQLEMQLQSARYESAKKFYKTKKIISLMIYGSVFLVGLSLLIIVFYKKKTISP